MKYLLSMFALIGLLFLSGCQNEDDFNTTLNDDVTEFNDDFITDCFAFVFPISYTMPDGSTLVINNEDEWESAFDDWYANNPPTDVKPALQYPVQVITPDNDQIITLQNEDELIDLKQDCYGDYDKFCFEFVFPLTVIMPDGSTITNNDEDEFWSAITDWYDTHPDVDQKPEFQYPIQIILADVDEIITVNDDDEFEDYLADCWDEEEDCYEFVFPLTVIMPDGSTITGNDEHDLEQAIEDWYDAHPDVDEEPVLQFPVQVITLTSDVPLTVNNEDDLDAIEDDCWDDEEDDCYEFVFPLTVIMPDGSTITGNNEDELEQAIDDWYDAHPDVNEEPALQFPVQVITLTSDVPLTVNNEDDLDAIEDDCWDDEEDDCYEFVFPLTIIMPDGSTITGNNEDELEQAIDDWYDAHPDVNEEPALQFPVQVITLTSDVPLTVNNEDDLDAIEDDCD